MSPLTVACYCHISFFLDFGQFLNIKIQVAPLWPEVLPYIYGKSNGAIYTPKGLVTFMYYAPQHSTTTLFNFTDSWSWIV